MKFQQFLQSQHPTPDSLDDLVLVAERFAGRAMQTFGSVPPTLVARGAYGVAFLSPDQLADESAKDEFAQIARLVCVAHAATASVLVLEAWIAPIGTDMGGSSSVPPSESPHRREVVVLAGESYSGNTQTILPIVRAPDGRFLGFGERESLQTEHAAGRFAGLMPACLPSRADQDRASLILATMGIPASGSSRQPNAN